MNKEIIQIELTSLSHDGRAVGRLDARVVFVEHALPGQTVRAAITKSKKNFAEATCLEVLQDAPDSISAPCPHADICGGCSLQTMSAATQLHWKERIVHEAMTRIAKLAPEQSACIAPIVPSPQAWEYRNKMEFAFGQGEDGSLVLGMRGKGSHTVVPVPHCKLMPQGCMDVVRQVTALCKEAKLQAWVPTNKEHGQDKPGILRHLIIRRPHTLSPEGTPQLLVNLITAPAGTNLRLRISRLGQDLMNLCSNVTAFVFEERRNNTMIAQGEHVISKIGNTLLREELGDVQYTLGYNTFFQINTPAAQALCTEINTLATLDMPEKDTVCLWDLYCGVGAPGLSLVRHLGSEKTTVYGVEINPKAIEIAKKTAQGLNYTAHYEAGDTKKVISKWPTPDCILLDPPRTGMAPEVVEQVKQSQAERIIYVSCNPATLARDIALLSDAYELKKLTPLDFFPQTPHVESCVLLIKK